MYDNYDNYDNYQSVCLLLIFLMYALILHHNIMPLINIMNYVYNECMRLGEHI